jgi:hypothetical protein
MQHALVRNWEGIRHVARTRWKKTTCVSRVDDGLFFFF